MEPTYGTVTAPDPDNYGVFVILDGPFGQSGPTISVEIGTHGPRDAVRGHYPELPLPGQRGLIMFPRHDLRNAIWVCSVRSALNDSNPLTANSLPQHTELAYGGGVFWRGPDGSEFSQYPDGSTLQIGPSAPKLTRHTIGSGQARSATPFPLAQRAPSGVASFGLLFTQAGTGASLQLTASGGWIITAAPGQNILFQVSGGASTTLTSSQIEMVASTNVSMATPTLAVSGQIEATGNITADSGAGGGSVTLLNHQHGVGTPQPAGTVIPSRGT